MNVYKSRGSSRRSERAPRVFPFANIFEIEGGLLDWGAQYQNTMLCKILDLKNYI